MATRLLLTLLLAGATALPLAAQGVARVDPRLYLARRLAQLCSTTRAVPVAPGEAGAVRPLAPGVAARVAFPGVAPLAVDTQGRTWLRTLARVAPGGARALEAAGARIATRAGDVVTALVPVDALDSVAAAPGLIYLEAADELYPELGSPAVGAAAVRAVAGPRAAADQVRSGAAVVSAANDTGILDSDIGSLRQREGDTFLGLAGQGVVVGLYDTGLDLTHRDFIGPNGSRVRWAWDQTDSAGTAPGQVGSDTYTYGRECTHSDVVANTCPMRDLSGHGTHVAGTAAGSGAATGKGMPAYRFTGVAPDADLIVVKGGDTSFSSDKLLDGVAYIFERARELGEPGVVNLSLETQNGPHDGSTNFERALDALAGPGRILAVAAGNSAVNADETPAFVHAPVHAGGRLTTGASQSFDIVVPAYTPTAGAANDGAILDMWYAGSDSLALVITSPGGERVRIATGDTVTFQGSDGSVVVDNASGGTNPNNGDREAVIALADLDASAPPAAGRWKVEVDGSAVAGSGRWDLWLVGSTMRTATQLTALDGATVSNTTLVSSPGTATRAITVAAYANREEWLGPGAVPQTYPFQEQPGDIAFFSDPGPRRDGVLKPEIAAPGKVVVSSLSRDASIWNALPTYIEADGVHAVLMGTSMASPFVAGAAALLLQLRPTLTPEELRTLLASSARHDAFTAHTYTGLPDGPSDAPNAQWGYGKLDVAAAVHQLHPPAGSLSVEVAPDSAGAMEAWPDGGRVVAPSLVGARLALLRLSLAADSAEAQQVLRLGFDLTGRDTAATLLIVRDLNDDGLADPEEPVVDSLPVRLQGGTLHVTMPGPWVPPGARRGFVVALQLGPGVPNAARFSASYRPDDLITRGTLSGVQHVAAPPSVVASPQQETTVLFPGEDLNLSQNPVRSAPLIINYRQRPRAIYIYAVTGARVRALTGAALEDGRALWDLRNDHGERVAPGIYLLVVDGPDHRLLRKLLVAR